MNVIKWNGKRYIQDNTGAVVPLYDLIRNEEDIHNVMMPQITARMNHQEGTGYCSRCNTAYRMNEIKQGNRCPFCWKIIA